MYYTYTSSPLGDLLLAGASQLEFIGLPEGKRALRARDGWKHRADRFAEAERQLRAYFAGELRTFELPLKPQGTPFQLAVLDALLTIPYGETRSYGELAAQLGRPKSARAVGAANGRNPLPIMLPCHRVIGSGGQLTGFGGGLPAKRFLLDLEQGVSGLC